MPFLGYQPILPYSNLAAGVRDLKYILNRHDDQLLQPLPAGSTLNRYPLCSKAIAIDVECATGASGFLPVRIALVDYHGQVIMHRYIIPTEEVTDWKTEVHGIDASTLITAKENGTLLSLNDAVFKLKEWCSGDILVGHNVLPELRLLNVSAEDCNCDIVDTQSLARYASEGLHSKPNLRDVVQRYFGIKIQQTKQSCLENARATMLVYRAFRDEFSTI